MSTVRAPEPDAGDIYNDFDAFLRSAIYSYYQGTGRKRKGNFIALIIASGEIPALALDSIKTGAGAKKVAIGAASILALRIGLKYAISGPLGIILAGATAVSLVTYLVRNRGEIVSRIGANRAAVATLRTNYTTIQSDLRDGRTDEERRNLMLDGLMKRFLSDLDQ